MKRVLAVLSPKPRQVWVLLLWAMATCLLPMGLFVVVAFLQAPSRPAPQALPIAELWKEPLGDIAFDQPTLRELSQTAPDFDHASWETVMLPNSVELGASVDMPDNAPKARVWFRLRVPPELMASEQSLGQLVLMGNRVVGGPWAVRVNGSLLRANLADWRMQWNTPLRVALPPNTTEVLLGIPYVEAAGYALGSLFIGPADVVHMAWQARNFWQADAPRAASLTAVLLFVMSLPLALGRPKEPVFVLLSATALVWSLTNLQYFYDFTGQDSLSKWFGIVMDLSINWIVVLTLLFAFELARIAIPRLRVALVLYAVVSTVLALPIWGSDQYALLSQHYGNIIVFTAGIGVLAWHVSRSPRREGVVLLLALVAQLLAGAHSLLYVASQTHPDHVHTFPLAGVAVFTAFLYAISRRTVTALNRSDSHQQELEYQLAAQEKQLAKQLAVLHQLETDNRLATQREALLQDLHDGLGSNLTSALLQARGGHLSQENTVLLLQDLTQELRHLSASTASSSPSANDILVELRQRVQNRLAAGGIALIWDVDIDLPSIQMAMPNGGQHLRALLSEGMANAIKHAGATQITVSAKADPEAINISITDNGKGFVSTQIELGRGLPGMRQRAVVLGASLDLLSKPGQGTTWRLCLPWAGA